MANEVKKNNLVNCLRKERIIVRHINKPSSMVKNPKHPLYGGMAENAVKTFVVPMLESGRFVNVLTDSEKAFLENYLGLEDNALSIYKRDNNFWDDSNPDGISKVSLKKQDNYLDLSNPQDYIKYKILLANKDFICPSLDVLNSYPKATYQFVIIAEGDESKDAKSKLNVTALCYKEYGKVEDNADVLRYIIETLDGRPLAQSTKLEFMQAKIYELIQANPKEFVKVITDEYLSTKVMLRKAIQNGVVSRKGDYLYLRSDNSPLCEEGEEPTLQMAAIYLNNPKHQEIKFSIEAKLKE